MSKSRIRRAIAVDMRPVIVNFDAQARREPRQARVQSGVRRIEVDPLSRRRNNSDRAVVDGDVIFGGSVADAGYESVVGCGVERGRDHFHVLGEG